MNSAAPQDYWDGLYVRRELVYMPDRVLFKDVFARVCPRGGHCFEVGCYPGDYLLYLSKTYGYVASGIDMTPQAADELPKHCRANGVEVGDILQGDFFGFEPARNYDLVCSFGFIEHFVDCESVIERHARLLANGGVLFISAPNFRWIQFSLHWLLDRQNLHRHVTAAMSLSRWRRDVERLGLRVLEEGYYGRFGFWYESPTSNRWIGFSRRHIARRARRIDQASPWPPNRFTSPFLYLVAKKA